jgi:phosphatidate cytidylyltransferase
MTNLFLRIASAIFLLFIFSFSFFNENSNYFLTFIILIAAISLYELDKILNQCMINRILYWSISLLALFFYFKNTFDPLFLIYISSFFWIFIAFISVLRGAIIFEQLKFLYGLFIICSLLISILFLFYNDRELLFVTFLIVWISDISAYFFGRKYGKKRLAPLISPGKTVEGFVGAFLCTFILFCLFSLFHDFEFPHLYILILFVVPFSVMGDLFESLLKRSAKIKDSGKVIPGHGGLLDRIDALCPVLPFVALLNNLGIF